MFTTALPSKGTISVLNLLQSFLTYHFQYYTSKIVNIQNLKIFLQGFQVGGGGPEFYILNSLHCTPPAAAKKFRSFTLLLF